MLLFLNIAGVSETRKNSCEPPDISVAILELKDLNPPRKSLDCVHLPIVEVLLLVVEDDELLSSYSFLKDTFMSYITELGLVYFGVTGDDQNKVKICLVRCGKGSTQVHASQNVARTAIKTLKPKAVFSVGCCAGLNRTEAKLGDVVISAKLSTFGDKKVIHDQRLWDGRTLDVSRKFGSLIKSAADGWKAPLKNPDDGRNVKVHRDAEILTGVEVVNSFEECKRLRRQFPEAIAIEQEGQG